MASSRFRFSKALGQNFLINPSVCPRMALECGAVCLLYGENGTKPTEGDVRLTQVAASFFGKQLES